MIVGVAASSADWVTAGATVATAVVLFGSAVFALWQLRESQHTRSAELLTDLSRRWDEPLLREARLAASKLDAWELAKIQRRMWTGRRSPTDEAAYYRLMPLANFAEAIAVLVLDVSGVTLANIDTLWGGTILGTWAKWELAIRIIRRKSGTPTSYANFEELVEALKMHRIAAETTWTYHGLMAPPTLRRVTDVAH